MASIMLCEGGHTEPVVGNTLLQWLETGESNVFCAACFEQAMWALAEALPTFDDRVKGYMNAIIEKEANRQSNATRRRRKAGLPEQEPKDSEPAGADAESTATDQ